MTMIRRPEILLGMMDDGELMNKLAGEIDLVMARLADLGERGTAKGTITLKLNFTAKQGRLDIKPALTSSVPEVPLRETPLFYTEEGELSTQHPKQINMFDGPREAKVRDTETA